MELGRINQVLDSADMGSLLIAESIQGRGLGFAFFGEEDLKILAFTDSDPKRTLELRLFYFMRDQRGQGTGSQLLRRVEQIARETGKDRIELTNGPRYWHNGSREFYLKRGFHLLPKLLEKYFEGLYPARVFQKDLN